MQDPVGPTESEYFAPTGHSQISEPLHCPPFRGENSSLILQFIGGGQNELTASHWERTASNCMYVCMYLDLQHLVVNTTFQVFSSQFKI